jgi:CRP/FNR family cyclic AMP-dependent transcriptional regulator
METIAKTPSCFQCDARPDRAFCDMPHEALLAFDGMKSIATYPKGAILFTEGRPSRGVYVLCSGRAKLTVCSENGKRLLVRVAGPGEVLGLGAAISGTNYELNAELLDSSPVAFIRRKDLIPFLRDFPDVCMQIVRVLSQDLHGAYERVRNVGMARTRRPRSLRAS